MHIQSITTLSIHSSSTAQSLNWVLEGAGAYPQISIIQHRSAVCTGLNGNLKASVKYTLERGGGVLRVNTDITVLK